MNLRHHLVFAACLSILSCQSASTNNSTGSKPYELRGTYADATLQRDVLQAVYIQAATQDCQTLESVYPYILEKRTGDDGERRWVEKWIARGCGDKFTFIIHFQEAGERRGGTYFHTALVK